jgi:hypothetical protein
LKTEKKEKDIETYEDLKNFGEEKIRKIDQMTSAVIESGKDKIKNGVNSVGGGQEDIEKGQEAISGIQQEILTIATNAKQEIRNNIIFEKIEEESTKSVMINREMEFLQQATKKAKEAKNEKMKIAWEGLKARYEDKSTDADYLQEEIEKNYPGLEKISELEGKKFDSETKKIILEKIRNQLEELKETMEGKFLFQEIERYIDLIELAQQEGDLPKDLEAKTVLELLERNVQAILFQDKVADENLLGDHGIRHIEFNISIGEKIFDELEKNGQKVKAIDRLMMHQIVILHDIGYATKVVREGVDRGEFLTDRGHELLAAKIVRQRSEDEKDPLSKVFSKEQLLVIHEGVLSHSDSEIRFHIGDQSKEGRKENLLSVVRAADNMHAFEDKLPELLYSLPETLKILRLLKTAGEIGDLETVEELKGKLITEIEKNPSLPDKKRKALIKAVRGISAETYIHQVGRICGKRPEVKIDQSGILEITVQESSLHQEVVRIFDMEAYTQLKKFIKDLTGLEEVSLDQDEIVSKDGKVKIKVIKGKSESGEKSDYEKRVGEIVTDPGFREFYKEDEELANKQKYLEEKLKTNITEEEKIKYEEMLNNIKKSRQELIKKYISRG